jgi:O-antigen/teichoic acid export membrane protein
MLGVALATPAAVGMSPAGPVLGAPFRTAPAHGRRWLTLGTVAIHRRRVRRRRRVADEARSIARGSAEALLTRGVEVVLQVALLILTARLLEPAGRGLYALASLVALMCALPLGSVWTANASEFAHRRTALPDLLGASTAIALVGGTATALVALSFAPMVGGELWVIAIPAAIAPLLLLARYQEGLYQTLGHVRAVTAMILGRVMLPLAFMTPALLAGADARTAVALWAFSLGLLPLIVYVPLVRRIGGVRVPLTPTLYRRVVGTGLKLAVGNSALLLTSRMAFIALAIFTGNAAVGVYSVAVAAADILLVGANALDISSFRSIATRELRGAADLTLRSVRHSGLLAVAGALVLVPLTAVIVTPVLGAGYDDVPLLLAILAPGVAAHAAVTVLDAFFAVRLDRPARVTAIAVVVLATTVPLTFVLVPFAGAWGAALAATAGNLVGAALYVIAMRRAAGARIRDFVPGPAEVRDYAGFARRALPSRDGAGR